MMQNNAHSKVNTCCHLKIMQLVKLFNILIVDEVFKLPLHRINKIVIITKIYIYSIYTIIIYFWCISLESPDE